MPSLILQKRTFSSPEQYSAERGNSWVSGIEDTRLIPKTWTIAGRDEPGPQQLRDTTRRVPRSVAGDENRCHIFRTSIQSLCSLTAAIPFRSGDAKFLAAHVFRHARS